MFKDGRTFPAGKVTTARGIEANRELYIVRGEQCCATDSDIEKAVNPRSYRRFEAGGKLKLG